MVACREGPGWRETAKAVHPGSSLGGHLLTDTVNTLLRMTHLDVGLVDTSLAERLCTQGWNSIRRCFQTSARPWDWMHVCNCHLSLDSPLSVFPIHARTGQCASLVDERACCWCCCASMGTVTDGHSSSTSTACTAQSGPTTSDSAWRRTHQTTVAVGIFWIQDPARSTGLGVYGTRM